MTINEQIAKVMEWGYCPDSEYCYFHDGNHWTDLEEWVCVKALQQRIIDDGWNVSIHYLCDPREDGKPFMAYAYKADDQNIYGTWMDTEPAAIVDLFMKVYRIKEGN